MSDDKALSYYYRNREARKAYQRAHYQKVKEQLRRKREVARELETEGHSKYLEYQREYYRKNKKRIAKKRKQAREQARRAKEQG